MKGIILAGGSGTRLSPVTKPMNKHLLPVYDKPMIYYPLSTLILAGIRDVLLITTPDTHCLFQTLLGDGADLGLRLSYLTQKEPKGIADAFIIGESFIGNDSVCLILGDNIFQGTGLKDKLESAKNNLDGASVFAYYVDKPSSYGVVEFDDQKRAIAFEEKPTLPKSNYAVTGLYLYDNHVINIAKSLSPSRRGELEITDVNNAYVENSKIDVNILGRGFVWLDMGTPDSLLAASNYIQVVEKRQGLKVACIEEMAWRMGFINSSQFEKAILRLPESEYRQYLYSIFKESA